MTVFLALFALTVAVASLAVTVLRGRALRRASDEAHTNLASVIHDQALALDRRCDVLQGQLDDLAKRQRIDHLLDLIAAGEHGGRLDADAAEGLRRYALSLREESLSAGPADG